MKIEIDGVTANVVQKGNGKDVLLLHGWGCSTALFDKVMDALSADMRVTAIDFPGHGESGRPSEPWGVPEYAAWTMRLIDALGIAPCCVVAHSFGARVTLWIAAHSPDTFGRIVLTGAAGLRPDEVAKTKKGGTVKRMRDTLRRFKVLDNLADKLNEAYVQRFGSADYKALDPEMRKTFVKVINQDLSSCLPKIQSPTLLYWGDNDQETPLWMGKKMEKEIPNAALLVVNGTHYAYLEHLYEFNRIVHHFFTEDET